MNFGGSGNAISNEGNLYSGFNGFWGGLVVLNLTHSGLLPSISILDKLVSGLFVNP